jgi:DNA-directed RNA polymerase subunit K/omega
MTIIKSLNIQISTINSNIMDYKKTNASNTTVTRNFDDLEKNTDNIYESIVIMSKRSRQIQKDLKEELNKKLKDFASYTDNLEEIFENREQIEISKFYERLPKPELIAIQEFLEGKIFYKKPEIEE